MKYFLLFIVLFSQSLFAQVALKCVVKAENITPNDLFEVDYILNQQEDNFVAPNFIKSGLELVYGPSTSVTQNTINGKSTYSKTFSYILKASKTGTYSIDSATMTIDDTNYQSNTVSVSVQNVIKNEAFYNDYYLVAQTDKDDFCYNITEPIVVTFKLYYNKYLNIISGKLLNMPNFNNLITKHYQYDKPLVSQEIFKGKSYYVYVPSKVIVYPDQVGKFEFDSLGMKIKIKKFDGKISSPKQSFTTLEKEVFSNKPKVEICNQLPNNAPSSYTGAYGNFTIKIVKPKEMVAKKPFTIKIEISGDGNFDGFTFPTLEYVTSIVESDLDLKTLKSDVKIDNQDQNGAKFGILAKQTRTVTLLSEVKGKQTLFPVEFSFYNPESRRYETITTEEMVLEIK